MALQNDNHSGMRGLTIAGVRFALSGLSSAQAFAPAFLPFLQDVDDAEMDCVVSCDGPDDSLAAQPPVPDKCWSFTVCDGFCEVIRRDQEGQALWRITGPLSFERISVSWNPRYFLDFYGSYENAWSKGLGLTLLVLRLRAQSGLVFHGTAAELDGQGILCVGVSGVGKSTIARLLAAAGAKVLTDERPVLRQWPVTNSAGEPSNRFRIYGSPWPSSAGFAQNAWAPLRRLYFLEHGEKDLITPLASSDAVSRLIHVATIPWQDAALLDPYLKTVESLLHDIPCAVLAFRPTSAVVDVIRSDRRSAGAK